MCYSCARNVLIAYLSWRAPLVSQQISINWIPHNRWTPSSDRVNMDTISSVMAQLRQLQENVATISINTETLVQSQERNFSVFYDKIDQRLTARASEDHYEPQIITKLNDLQHCINSSTIHSKRSSPDNGEHGSSSSSVLRTNSKKNLISTDPLNWSFSFNQTTIPNDNVELFQLLHGFEKNT